MATPRSKPEKLGEVERVYRLLREWVISARLKPGEFLAEGDLASRCRTSRTPVREACTRLMQDKWLSRIPHKGFLVTPISVRDMVDLYEYRKLLEGFAAEHVAQSATAEQIDELKAILAPETRKRTNLEEVLAANERFHMRLAELAGNQRVCDQLRLSLAYVSRLDTLCTQTVPGWIGHGEILSAIEARKSTQARLAMARHIDASRDKMIRLFST
ncbi:MAG: GntR family transcriptional regulator [Bryobacteraceae bacterium]